MKNIKWLETIKWRIPHRMPSSHRCFARTETISIFFGRWLGWILPSMDTFRWLRNMFDHTVMFDHWQWMRRKRSVELVVPMTRQHLITFTANKIAFCATLCHRRCRFFVVSAQTLIVIFTMSRTHRFDFVSCVSVRATRSLHNTRARAQIYLKFNLNLFTIEREHRTLRAVIFPR